MAAKKNPYGGVLYNPEASMSGKDLHNAAKQLAEAKFRSAIDQSRRDTTQYAADSKEGLRRLQGYYDSYKPDMAKGVDSDSYQIAKSLLAQKNASVPSNAGEGEASYSDKVKNILGNYADRHLISAQQSAEGRNTAILQRAKEDYGQANNFYTRRVDDSRRKTSDLLSQYGGEYNSRLLSLRQSEGANAAARKKAEYDYQLGQQRLQMEQQRYNNELALRQAGLLETTRHNRASEGRGPSFDSKEKGAVGQMVGQHLPALAAKHSERGARLLLERGWSTKTPMFQNGRLLKDDKGNTMYQTIQYPPYLVDAALRDYKQRGGKFASPKKK